MSATRLEIPYPEFTAALRGLNRVHYEVNSSPLPRTVVDLVRLRVSQMNGCSYCVQQHWAEAREHGVPERELALLSVWRTTVVFDDSERAALRMAEALTALPTGSERDEAVADVNAHFDHDEAVALLMAIAEINAWNRLAIGGGRHAL